METTLGSAIESSSGSTGFSFIKVSFIEKNSPAICKSSKRGRRSTGLQPVSGAQKSHTMALMRSLCGEK